MIIDGPDGTRYEAHWGRKRVNSVTFIGRVHLLEPGGGLDLWRCDHKHPMKAEAEACAQVEAAKRAAAAFEAAARRPSPEQMLADLLISQAQFMFEHGIMSMEFVPGEGRSEQ